MEKFKISGFADEIAEDIDTQFKVLNKLGIKYFEPRGIDGKNISQLDKNEVRELKNKMDFCGIKASSIGSPVGKIKLSEDFDAHFEMYKRIVETANQLDSKYIRIFSFYSDGEFDKHLVFERLYKLTQYAKSNGVVLLHENEKDIFGDTIVRCAELFHELYCDNFKGVFDPANFVQCGEDTKEALDTLYKYIGYFHIKDAMKDDGRIVPPGLGDGNINYIISKLKHDNYDGFISLEPHLGNFKGLADLEQGDIMKDLPDGGEHTYTLAYNSLKNIIERV